MKNHFRICTFIGNRRDRATTLAGLRPEFSWDQPQMPKSTPDSAYLIARAYGSGQRNLLLAFLWMACSLGTAIGIFALSYLVAAQKQREAGRMIVAEQKGADYVSVVVAGLAARHGRPAGQ